MEVQIISKQNVRPSSPTPPHLRNFKLSLLDQLIPVPYAPLLLYYPMNDNSGASNLDVPKRLGVLQKSLSETLTRFYPLAGKIKDELSIDCNDEGAYYVEAQVNCHLSEFLRQPDLLLVHQFFPCELPPKAVTHVANFQVNVFECGGIAIGICISHRILDGAALSTFLKAWSATARGGKEAIIYPEFVSSSLFPANDLRLRDSAVVMFGSLFKKGKGVTKRFVFDASSISSLRAQAASLGVECPTRVEVVSSFLWKCFMAASEEWRGSQRRPSLLTHLVNLRRKMEPKLGENSMGNFLWLAAAKCMNKSRVELNDLVGEVRKAISKIDSDFVEQIKGDEGNSPAEQTLKEIGEFGSKDGVDYLGFSSWCRFGFYDADFGWGKPVWISSFAVSGSLTMNLIILADTRLLLRHKPVCDKNYINLEFLLGLQHLKVVNYVSSFAHHSTYQEQGPVIWKPGLLTSILMNSLANLTSWQCVNFFPVKESTAAVYVTSVQENVFECGGNGIGMCTCHKFLDGAALSSFLKAWTATA
ncbi:hypothetical protein D5086_004078 [Populus alba]|uniref:Uncharacterized protein n=1 Tax=Populus alba TaxID=43335 RepID=A0ACC4CPH8_POPAL